MAGESVRQMVMRHNDGPLAQETGRISLASLQRELSGIRERGYSDVLRGVTPGAGDALTPAGVRQPVARGRG